MPAKAAPGGPGPKTGGGVGLVFFLALSLVTIGGGCKKPKVLERRAFPRCSYRPQDDVTLVAESDRPMDRVVMGLGPNDGNYFSLPVLRTDERVDKRTWETLRKQLFWLDLELSHGQVWEALPQGSRIYLGIPSGPGGQGTDRTEREWFEEYLVERWKWSLKEVRDRVFFFDTTTPIIWGQDIGEVMGYDGQDRVVVACGKGEPDWYRGSVLSLVKAYPDDFILKDTSPPVSTEGGDLELVWGADGQPRVLAGRFAAVRYFQRDRGGFPVDQAVSMSDIFEARSVFQKDLYGLPVEFLPRSCLLDPSKGEKELFHLDMIAAVFSGPGTPKAFVPTYLSDDLDPMSGRRLDPAFKKRLQGEFDQTALQLVLDGYEVHRLPFDDHPVRSPANLVKYYDPVRERQVVLLSKYPYVPRKGGVALGPSPLNMALNQLWNWAATWQADPSDPNLEGLERALNGVWAAMDGEAAGTNPIFERQKAILEKCGYEVVPVPMFPWGAGGLHCETLH